MDFWILFWFFFCIWTKYHKQTNVKVDHNDGVLRDHSPRGCRWKRCRWRGGYEDTIDGGTDYWRKIMIIRYYNLKRNWSERRGKGANIKWETTLFDDDDDVLALKRDTLRGWLMMARVRETFAYIVYVLVASPATVCPE